MKFEQVQRLSQLLAGPLDEAARQELTSLLATQPELVSEYVEQFQVHSLLEASLATGEYCSADGTNGDSELSHVVEGPANRSRFGRLQSLAIGVCAAGLAALAVNLAWKDYRPPLGTIVSAKNVSWERDERQLLPGHEFASGTMRSSGGSCELKFATGVELLCDGEFRLRIVDGMLVELIQGRIRANVSPAGKGFAVDTPDTYLVDHGTEFGVNADGGLGTQVVVFKGEVDVSTKHSMKGDSTRRLFQGEAAELKSGRAAIDRVSQVISGSIPANWSAGGAQDTILSIRDNIRTADSLKYYNVITGGLQEDVLAWVDRPHQWNGIYADGIPKIIRGAEFVQTFNDDRYNPSFEMTVTVKKPATLYLIVDDRVAKKPDWLLKDFEDTGEDLGLDEGLFDGYIMQTAHGAGQSVDQIFSIWKRVVPEPTEITLGWLGAPPNFGMYGLAATPLE